jgi:superfamily II DNA/RNA helicase
LFQGELSPHRDQRAASFRFASTTREAAETNNNSSNKNNNNGFGGLGISSDLVGRVAELGIRSPTEIQREAIQVLLQGKHAAIEGYTGSGKTLAYLLPILQQLQGTREEETAAGSSSEGGRKKGNKNGLRALIIVPSQELAMQICRVAQSVASDKKMVQQAIGGANKKRQIEQLKRNCPQVVVGTPGRLADLSNAGHLQTHFTEHLVLDEADKLIHETYARDLDKLQQHIGKKCAHHQRVLCSATLTESIGKQFVQRGWISPDYTHVSSSGAGVSPGGKIEGGESDGDEMVVVPELSPHLDHCWVSTPKVRKADTVRKCINALNPKKVLIFHNFSNQLVQTAAKLRTGQIETAILDGKMNKDAKKRVIQSFTRGDVRALVASEAATRGLDFPGCDCVVNMDMPHDLSHYVHRAGRTGRGVGNHGVVISVPSGKEVHVIKKYARKLRVSIGEYKVTHGEMVEAAATQAATTAEQGL